MQLLRETTNASVEDCAAALLEGLPPVMWFIRRHMRQHRGALSVPQFRALVKVERQPSISVSAVAEHLAASLPTTSRMMTGLVEKGFLRRIECPTDRRQVSLAITARGQRVLSAARRQTQKMLADEVAGFTPEERATITAAMQTLGDRFACLRSATEGSGECAMEVVLTTGQNGKTPAGE
jgi:MarR family multiple antibiotic resistance transcriptional regulator